MLPLLLQQLAASGLSLLSGAIIAKGKNVIEQKLGVNIESAIGTEEGKIHLRELEIQHEAFLINATIKQKEQEIESEKNAQSAVTERWKADMISDSWLSKNVRPLVLAFWTVAIVVLMTIPVAIDSAWIELVKISYTTILAAYFLGRTYEKHVDMKERGK